MKKTLRPRLAALAASVLLASPAVAAEKMSLAVPDALDREGRKVLTFIAKDPPGQRCNGNLQVAAEIANTYLVPIQLLPSTLAPGLPAPAVFYGAQNIAADGGDHNGGVSYQIVADILEMEGVPKQGKAGLLFNGKVRQQLDSLKATIKQGGK
ncbi:MAG: hypothetical protein Q7T38_11285 [Gallionella sp.]|nr:hypothetical protein [Gallionella sp.]